MRHPPMADDGSSSLAKAKPCPICGKPPTVTDRPFCSNRCAVVDLHRWLGGVYAVPASPDQADDSGDTMPPLPTP